jgi:predicted AlkP superfamily phosphohydrolase/phosphomutase
MKAPRPLESSPPRGRLRTFLLLCALFVVIPGCGPTYQAQPEAPVLLLGVDGLEWEVLRPLMEAGRCPNLRALAEAGSYGKLGTFIPTHSPVVWTSIATGKRMEAHGITSFVDPQGRAFTSSRRSGRALWNIADRYGLSSAVYGWWITWPVEAVRGVMVSGTSAVAQLADNWKPALMPGVEDQVSPPELTDRVLALAAEAGSMEALQAIARQKVFGDYGSGVMGAAEDNIIDQTLWSVQSDATYFQIAATLMPEFPSDLTLVYFGGPDVAGHRFWRQLHPEQFAYTGTSDAADEALADVLPSYYAWVDEMLGELIALAGEGTNVFVVSDHGMHAVATQEPNKRHITGDHQDGAPGVLIAAGPSIRRQGDLAQVLKSGALPTHGSVYSVAPTVLGLLGIPASRNMEARVYPNILTPAVRESIAALELVPTHDDGFRDPSMVAMSAEGEAEFKKRMAELGYLDLPAARTSRPVNPDGFVPDPSATSGTEDG